MPDKYILTADRRVQSCEDLKTWGAFMETGDRIVAQTQVSEFVRISTAFLGLDHSFGEAPEPMTFETIVSKDGRTTESCLYSDWELAKSGHDANVKRLMGLDHG
ncbi:MAG: hypothetical protein ACRC62_23780 [Microcoleus sp.]